jgi:site-specific recombinase XerD
MQHPLTNKLVNESVITLSIVSKAEEYARASRSANTIRAYQSDWKYFIAWCTEFKTPSLPSSPDTIAIFLVQEAENHKVSTIVRRLSAISEAHRIAGYSSPCDDERVKTILKGIKRTKGVAPSMKSPLLTDQLRNLLVNLPNTKQGIRDRALLLLGFTGAFRRSEIVALDRDDLTFVKEGILVRVKRSKTDQEGLGVEKAIPYGSSPELCPVRAVEAWLVISKIEEGALFVSIGKGDKLHTARLSDRSVALIIKKLIEQSGSSSQDYSGHSLRSGFVTQAALNGASDRAIMNQTKHRSRAMVDRYVRVASIWTENGAMKLGL